MKRGRKTSARHDEKAAPKQLRFLVGDTLFSGCSTLSLSSCYSFFSLTQSPGWGAWQPISSSGRSQALEKLLPYSWFSTMFSKSLAATPSVPEEALQGVRACYQMATNASGQSLYGSPGCTTQSGGFGKRRHQLLECDDLWFIRQEAASLMRAVAGNCHS